MLALTECHSYRTGVSAMVLSNPITDWTAFYTEEDALGGGGGGGGKTKSSTSRKAAAAAAAKAISTRTSQKYPTDPESPTLNSLLTTRTALFQYPEHYHDPFTSPLLFFRTSSTDLPPTDPLSIFQQLSPSSSSSPETPPSWIKNRRAHRRYPPLDSDLLLPRTRIDVGKENVLKSQGVELAESVNRSVRLYEEKMGRGVYSHGDDGEEIRAEIKERNGAGIWKEEDLIDVGNWIAKVMR